MARTDEAGCVHLTRIEGETEKAEGCRVIAGTATGTGPATATLILYTHQKVLAVHSLHCALRECRCAAHVSNSSELQNDGTKKEDRKV